MIYTELYFFKTKFTYTILTTITKTIHFPCPVRKSKHNDNSIIVIHSHHHFLSQYNQLLVPTTIPAQTHINILNTSSKKQTCLFTILTSSLCITIQYLLEYIVASKLCYSLVNTFKYHMVCIPVMAASHLSRILSSLGKLRYLYLLY